MHAVCFSGIGHLFISFLSLISYGETIVELEGKTTAWYSGAIQSIVDSQRQLESCNQWAPCVGVVTEIKVSSGNAIPSQ